ncbi:MAG: NADH dehydrogenase subunit [Hyphomicrobiales bacterium]|nr:MAG: NADH dehydrogenase subunit [Hyphomicrobiales bacterium]
MSLLDILLVFMAISTVVLYLGGNRRGMGVLATAVYAAAVVLVAMIGTQISGADVSVPSALAFTVFGAPLGWAIDGLGWFFALLTTGAAFFSAFYMTGPWGAAQKHPGFQRGTLALNVLVMLLLVSSADLLSLFIGWEFVSWSAYLMMTQLGGAAARAALRYLLYAMAGAMALFAAIMIVHAETGSFAYADLQAAVMAMPTATLWLLAALFAFGFGVKMALVPTHLWQAPAYSETPGASSAFLNAVSARMGLFALIVTLVKLLGFAALSSLVVPVAGFDMRDILLWIAAITMVVPTYIALQQTDARMLLTWHGIGQGGYMLLGILVATPLGVSGGLLHVFNYATYQAALFLTVTAVIYRTGTSDLDRLGGLINRMPFSYVTLLMGIIGLAGLPPMNGFVSKWMIYKSLIVEQQPLLSIAAFVATLGTILSVYKLIHNIFLGQLRKEHWEVKEAPWQMVVPMLALGGIGFITGWMPGLALDLVDKAQAAIGVAPLAHHLGGVELANGSLNMLWVVSVLLGAIGVGAVIFYFLGNRHIGVHQYDNYAGGHFLSSDIRYHYSHEFYPGLNRVIGPWYRGTVVKAERSLETLLQFLASAWRGFYQTAYTPLYLVIVVALGLAWASFTGIQG